jgi:hypothetical protein
MSYDSQPQIANFKTFEYCENLSLSLNADLDVNQVKNYILAFNTFNSGPEEEE